MEIDKLKQAKKDLGYTYKDISKLSGVPLRTIEDMFAERTNPRIDTVEAIEKVLGIERTGNVLQQEKSLSENEQALIELFNKVPTDKQALVLSMIEGALKSLK